MKSVGKAEKERIESGRGMFLRVWTISRQVIEPDWQRESVLSLHRADPVGQDFQDVGE